MLLTVERIGAVYVATGLVQLLFLRFALANRDTPGSTGFGVMVVGISIWATGSGVGALFPGEGPSRLAFFVMLFGGQLASFGWVLLAVEFVDPDRLTRRLLAGIAVVVVGWMAVIVTNPIHRRMWGEFMVAAGSVELAYGPVWWPFVGMLYLLLLAALAVLLSVFVTNSGAKRMQAGAFALATVPVFVAATLTIFNIGVGSYDVTPLSYLIVFPIVAWALYRARFLEVLPVARRTVVEEMQDAVVTFDREDQVADFNAAAADLLDLDGGTIGDRAAEVFAIYGNTARTFSDAENVETEVTVDHDGTKRQFHLTISPLGREPTTGGGRVVVLREITTLKRREAELRERERQFDLLRQVLSRVLRHNLRNGLQVIRTRTNSIPDADPEEVPELVDTVVATADDLAQTGENARRLERVIDGDGDPAPIDVATVAATVVERAREDHPGATIRLDVPEWAIAVADSHLALAVEDLVENAVVHARSAEPTVEVRVTVGEDAVVLAVIDDGPGIPEPELAVLESRGETDLQHGSGAGLWVVTWVVERSDGSLSFDTGPDGTTVRLRFPRADEADVPDAAGRPAQPSVVEPASDGPS